MLYSAVKRDVASITNFVKFVASGSCQVSSNLILTGRLALSLAADCFVQTQTSSQPKLNKFDVIFEFIIDVVN